MATNKAAVTADGKPREVERRGPVIKRFKAGDGKNNCPGFLYIRDGFGCAFNCRYCYLDRFAGQYFDHPQAEIYPPEKLIEQVRAALAKAKQPTRMIIGEVTDAWGWHHDDRVKKRNRELIEAFRDTAHVLVMLTKSHRVHEFLEGVAPTANVVMAWSVNAPIVAQEFEMGSNQARKRLDAIRRTADAGWRVQARIDPMMPIFNWQTHYETFAIDFASYLGDVMERVTIGSWRPRTRDGLYQALKDEGHLVNNLEANAGKDGRLRVAGRGKVYRAVMERWTKQMRFFPVGGVALCKEDPELEKELAKAFPELMLASGVGGDLDCNCLPLFPAELERRKLNRRLQRGR